MTWCHIPRCLAPKGTIMKIFVIALRVLLVATGLPSRVVRGVWSHRLLFNQDLATKAKAKAKAQAKAKAKAEAKKVVTYWTLKPPVDYQALHKQGIRPRDEAASDSK